MSVPPKVSVFIPHPPGEAPAAPTTDEGARLLAALLDEGPVAVAIVDRAHRCVHANRAFAEHDGRSAADLLRVPFTDDAPALAGRLAPIVRLGFETGVPVRDIAVQLGSGDRARHLTVELWPLADDDGQLRFVGLMLIDVTELRRATSRLVAAAREKDELLARIAHELRNPLEPIRTAAYLLRSGACTAERSLEIIDRQIGELVRLLDALPGEHPHAPRPAPEQAAPAARTATRQRILIVDDHVDAADVLAVFLKNRGYETAIASDGEGALTTARAFRPDAIVLDIGLPDIDGFEVARRLRADERTAGALLIALTGWGQESDRRHALQAGFDHHLTKPAAPPALARVLDESLRHRPSAAV
jgi:CheY-like chemotaxis protein